MAKGIPGPEKLARVELSPQAEEDWTALRTDVATVSLCHAARPASIEALGMPFPREWYPRDDDWKLPEGWQRIVRDGLRERLEKYRSLRLFMDICVRCGACADKCHFFVGTGDPRNMPVLRAELLRSIYRNDMTGAGRLLARLGMRGLAGNRELTPEVLKEWFVYFYQCSECRRCSVYCPYGIDTAEITMAAREILSLVGLSTEWVHTPVANCHRTGNHLGVLPHTLVDTIGFLVDELEEATGVRVEAPIGRKGAEVLFVVPSGDYFSDPGTYTMMGYLALLHEIGLDYTLSAYASEGGNFGLFSSAENTKRLNAKIYAEAKRLGVKWILGGECGHMWRVFHQYMDTMNGPADFLEVPRSPVTGTVFNHAASTKALHVVELTADLVAHGKLALDPARNDHLRVTFHDSCNPARAMGLLEEPRAVLRAVCNNFFEMDEETIREKTLCCGSGGGLNGDPILELRLRGGLPRAMAVRDVRERHGVDTVACICAIDRAALPPLLEYWVPGVDVAGVHELVANALVMEGERGRTTDLRGRPFARASAREEAKPGA